MTKITGKLSLLAGLGALLLVAGCSGQPEPGASLATGLSMSPSADMAYNCIIDKGWDVSIEWDGSIVASSDNIHTPQESLFDSDAADCMALIDNAIAEMSTDEISAAFGRELLTRDCLVGRGYDVAAPPSEQSYIDDFQGNRWSAYGSANIPLSQLSDAEWRELNQACPQPAWSMGVP